MNVTGDSKPHILYVITKASWGGATKYVYDMAVAARNSGYSVEVAYGSTGELSELLEVENISGITVPGLSRDISIRGDLKALRELITLMRKTRPTIVHANSSKAGLSATLAARFVGIPKIIFTAHGWAFNEMRPTWQKIIFALFHLITVWCSDEVICVSEAVRKDALWMPFSRKKLVVIHNGIEMEKVLPQEEARAKLAPGLDSKTWIGTLAELHPTKGLDVAIRAFAQVHPDFPDTTLVLIGDGQEREKLAALVSELKIEEYVHFCGQIKEAALYLSALDIFLFPSRSEALGFAVLEAGNASLPVVASNIGGIPEIIRDSTSGLLVPVNNVQGFSNALKKLLDDPSLAKSYGTNLHERVKNTFSKKSMIEKTLSLYAS